MWEVANIVGQVDGHRDGSADDDQGSRRETENTDSPRYHPISRAKPVRLGTNHTTPRGGTDPLQWRLATTSIAFNLAVTYHAQGFMVSPQTGSSP